MAAAGQRPDGLVLDGELAVWDTGVGRLSFQTLQRRRPRLQRPGPGRPVADPPGSLTVAARQGRHSPVRPLPAIREGRGSGDGDAQDVPHRR
ncbi:hypothetical protein ACQEVM_33690 [Streptomyces sp. CA-243310]|uniref:hypothetical protein n=1 Tax=Streptomyces sp. CA-243310 TaxID=3240056 RepID=UPI003D89F502